MFNSQKLDFLFIGERWPRLIEAPGLFVSMELLSLTHSLTDLRMSEHQCESLKLKEPSGGGGVVHIMPLQSRDGGFH